MIRRIKVRIIVIPIIFGALSLYAGCAQAQGEKLTLTTYYPSPYGEYRQILFYPNDDESVSCAEGELFYSKSEHTIKYCGQSNNWKALNPDLPQGIQCGMFFAFKDAATGTAHTIGQIYECVTDTGDSYLWGKQCPTGWNFLEFTFPISTGPVEAYIIKTCFKQ